MNILESIKLRPYTQHFDDALLEDMIADATTEVRVYCNLPESESISPMMAVCIKDLVVLRISKMGAEALTGESHGGESQSYLTDLPKDLRTRLNRIRRLPR